MEDTGSTTSGDLAQGAPCLSQDWLARQYSFSAAALLRSISATHLVKTRPGFGQVIRPVKGSVLASPVIAAYDPDPDYFFHWVRDSAIVMDALRCLIVSGALGREGLGHFEDFLAFSLRLVDLDGRAFLSRAGDFRQSVEPFFLQYVRSDRDLAEITGERALGEPRFNPDGTLDIIKWSRPQHDGPALRALTVMRFWALDSVGELETRAMQTLIERDLAFIHHCWREPSFDIWEEELGRHYYTRLAQYAALADGARWSDELGKPDRAQAYREAAEEIAQSLDEHWSGAEGFYLSRLDVAPGASSKDLDIATILAVIHADRKEGAHSVLDPKVLATLARLENLFETVYPINERRPEGCGPAMGRYAGDRYYSGGAYYFATLGAAQFYFRLAEAAAAGAMIRVTRENRDILQGLDATSVKNAPPPFGPLAPERRDDFFRAVLRRGDMFMATVEAYAPTSGELAEQFDQATGAPASAKDLAWSHAAFITAVASREAALRMVKVSLDRRGVST
ncbi:glycoside hydrolase family 15 protein [Methylocapsa polymorpha]|uniref:glucan 1,4-alpha-glucosidase n=1 Tax=Methylocapsa polymorpha TaxID=3080828 RepID=A0ABZ0HQY0_9HYPH|nr:glycoside hydrolase family 15 protein [Methylocapsa sp. RX1]